MMIRYGLLIVNAPILGAAIAATTSALTIGIFCFASSGHLHWGKANRKGLLFFLISGFMNFLSYVFMYSALAIERVSIVSPIVNSSSLFVLPLAFFLLRDLEQITTRKKSATVLVVLGVFLISGRKSRNLSVISIICFLFRIEAPRGAV